MASAMNNAAVVSAADTTAMLNTQLASALSTLGDAQFWEETISPGTIRTELSTSDPSNPNSTPTLQKGMKWLLASISKGRDVSDFYPHVVKLVGATSLEVRKMVYMYLVQYADHDATTRELSLLSINSFQRGLADSEQLIRALALRVLSSIRIADILQIQILGVQKCAKDRSPYVRKCAANALSKLAPRCDVEQREMLLEIVKTMLDSDTSTMVLSSAFIAFAELCPDRLDLLHTSYRKVCHLLTDMDEWGQVVILDCLARYCRRFFKEPRGWRGGTAERIDRERRVRRKATGIVQESAGPAPTFTESKEESGPGLDIFGNATKGGFSDKAPKKVVKRRVVQKGFYSDEEDESGEEEIEVDEESPIGGSMGQRNIMGLPGAAPTIINMEADEDMDLDEDHKLLLTSAMPLLKSRNAGVVLGVCSLLYYCGASSIKSRSAIGKALVRIHRGRREIQYVVLTSIRTLVDDCPSAFAPFLNDFFVKALDSPHTRILKVDILVSLALEPVAIEAVLKELRTYIRSPDKDFVRAAIRAVGRVAELARIVYDRHGQKSGDVAKERRAANQIALDCLYGLTVITQTGDNKVAVGEAVCVMQNILVMLMSDAGGAGSLMTVDDPNDVQGFAMRRLLLLLVNTLSLRTKPDEVVSNEDSDEEGAEPSDLEKCTVELQPQAVASALYLTGDWIANVHESPLQLRRVDASTKLRMRVEIARLVDQAFPDLDAGEKEQGIHLASKLLISSATGASPASPTEAAICEHILSMGRIDVNPDVKDRARMESGVVQASIGLKNDTENLDAPTLGSSFSLDSAKRMLLQRKPAGSFLTIEDVEKSSFRFGTLSSLVGHQARGAYLELPPWGEKNSPKPLRDPVDSTKEQVDTGAAPPPPPHMLQSPGFYGADESSSDDDSSSDSSSSESSDGQNADSESDSESSSDDSSSSSSDEGNLLGNANSKMPNNGFQGNLLGTSTAPPLLDQQTPAMVPSAAFSQTTSESLSSSESSSSSDEEYNGDISSANVVTPSEANLLSMGGGPPVAPANVPSADLINMPPVAPPAASSSSAMDDLKGLVMAPIVAEEAEDADPDIERDSSHWIQLVRHELCGGLSVRVRYLRGPTKDREAQLKGLDPKSPRVVCLQVQFANKKTDAGAAPLRRIRILPRSNPSGSIALKKSLCPQEISVLKSGQAANGILGFEFASVSNREGEMVARLDIKSSTGGGVPVELKVSLGELLLPHKTSTAAEFDATMNRMQGFQRVTSKFQSKNLAAIPTWVSKYTALTPVGQLAWEGNKLRLIGGLPASSDIVLVKVECDPTKGTGGIAVCCDHAVAVNSIMNIVKQAVAQ